MCRRQSDEQRSEVFPLKPKLWQASVHPWHGLLLIYCASVLCVRWKASSFLWLAASFLSHIFFLVLLSPLHLHKPPKRFLAGVHGKIVFGNGHFSSDVSTVVSKGENVWHRSHIFEEHEQKCTVGLSWNEGGGFFGQRGDVGFRRNRVILVSSLPAHTWPRIMGHLIPDVPQGLMPRSPRYWATQWNSHSTHSVTSYMCEMAAFHYGLN